MTVLQLQTRRFWTGDIKILLCRVSWYLHVWFVLTIHPKSWVMGWLDFTYIQWSIYCHGLEGYYVDCFLYIHPWCILRSFSTALVFSFQKVTPVFRFPLQVQAILHLCQISAHEWHLHHRGYSVCSWARAFLQKLRRSKICLMEKHL